MTSQNPLQLTESNFDEQVLRSDRPVLVDLWADWCAPCHAVAPIIDALAEQYAGRVKVAKLDVDANQNIARRFSINSVPHIMLFKAGRIVEQFVGVTSQSKLAAALDKLA